MAQTATNHTLQTKRHSRLLILFSLIILGIFVFLLSVLKTVTQDRKIPSRDAVFKDRSFRGKIYSKEGYLLATSRKSYKAVVRAESIVPEKKELFIRLFSIYSGIDEEKIRRSFLRKNGKAKRGNVILSHNIDYQKATQLKQLASKLRKLDVFRTIRNRSGVEVLYGLDIIETGESRIFKSKDMLSPVLGYVGKEHEEGYIRPVGKKGIEKAYEKYLRSIKDGYFKGKRDVTGAIIHDKNSIDSIRVDGLDVHLNTILTLQSRIETMLDSMQKRFDADEILVGVMESTSGKLLALAGSRRYNPARIRQKDIPLLNPKFSEYPFEPGSVIKPVTLAIALEKGKLTPHTWFDTHNGRMKIGKRTITDDHPYPSLDATGIIVHSSNIGISKIAWRLSGKEFRDGLLKFGFAQPSGIDLDRDLPGFVKKTYLLEHKLHRANSSYGYGMTATFAQLLRAYGAFNNGGILVVPKIVEYLEDMEGKRYRPKRKQTSTRAISKTTADKMHEVLKQVVQKGTGEKAKYPGLEIGGKTGTAHIAKGGRYVREYHSSFFGFANDKKGHRYTIGVLVIRAKKYRKYFAAQSAVPTFKKTVELLVRQGLLEPDPAQAKPQEQLSPIYTLPAQEAHSDTNPSSRSETIKELFAPNNPKPKRIKPKRQKPQAPSKTKKRTIIKIKSAPKRKTAKPSPIKHPAPSQRPAELFDDLF